MNAKKQNRRKTTAKLEPIDWREFANDAVLNGNMSTLYRRPPTEDPTTYASPEAMVEIEKRVVRPLPLAVAGSVHSEAATADTEPTVGIRPPEFAEPTVGAIPTEGTVPTVGTTGISNLDTLDRSQEELSIPTVGTEPSVGMMPTEGLGPQVGMTGSESSTPTAGASPTDCSLPTVGLLPSAPSHSAQNPRRTTGVPTVGSQPTAGLEPRADLRAKKIRPIRDVQDALTLAGQVLYGAMLGSPDGSSRKSCTKGYRQLATETRLDKDTVRDLILEFKEKGIVRETATYDPDTRLSKTYEVLSHETILHIWREAGILFVTSGRQRPQLCSAQGEIITAIPTVGS